MTVQQFEFTCNLYRKDVSVCVCMSFMDSRTAKPILIKLGMSPTYETRKVLGYIPMTLAHSNRQGSIATKPYKPSI